ncbi:MAG: hypothetical protein LQ351_002547 [Letrouitia transgressa]|nr:MAG: hypothetical protein LQ351_002547 [Letrouitia transgressa]
MSSNSLSGKVALITGGSKGIGRATAIRLSRDGAGIVINYSSDSTAAEEVVKLIGDDRVLAVKADAGNIADIESMVKQAVDKFGRIDILFANAGILQMKDLESTKEEDFDRTMTLNVKGPYFLVQKAVPHMAPGSHVILNSTTNCAASNVQPDYLLYNASKGAIEQMTRVLAKDLGRKGIRVNAVAPGPTASELFFRGKSEQLLKIIASTNPYNKIAEPEEIADTIAFLSSSDSRWVSDPGVVNRSSLARFRNKDNLWSKPSEELQLPILCGHSIGFPRAGVR